MYPGSKSYRFSYLLPKDLPYSLDGSKYGRIEYKAKAVVLMGNLKTSESMDEEFFLRSQLRPSDEAQIMAASKKLPLENVQYGRLGGGCFSKPFFLEVLLRLPHSVYYQGAMVIYITDNFYIYIENIKNKETDSQAMSVSFYCPS